eukprot:TRINITY_DN10452_c0_g1_i1.p1 TRINITY_DN10452_c0_g1~~TRINITY_DN10452_c0_g1_i1.p1  ORF type:complete len:433 (-),score=82.37 TRINITY_DN10452_c0_g1_i1:85-1383(-)
MQSVTPMNQAANWGPHTVWPGPWTPQPQEEAVLLQMQMFHAQQSGWQNWPQQGWPQQEWHQQDWHQKDRPHQGQRGRGRGQGRSGRGSNQEVQAPLRPGAVANSQSFYHQSQQTWHEQSSWDDAWNEARYSDATQAGGNTRKNKQRGRHSGDKGAWRGEASAGSSGTAAASAEVAISETTTASQCGAAPSTGKGQGSRGGKGSKGKGAWCDNVPRLVKISKTLTQILRHKAQELNIEIRSDGYCGLAEVLACTWLQELECTRDDVQNVVETSDKQRFEMKELDGKEMIRAVQGHSMKVVMDEELLKKLEAEDADLPQDCVHGTYRKHLDSICRHGLIAGGGQGQSFRNHVHFAPFAPGDKRVISGMRYDCEIAIWVDLRKAIAEGVPFYMSANKVILSPGVDGIISKKYFVKMRDLGRKEDLHESRWQDEST